MCVGKHKVIKNGDKMVDQMVINWDMEKLWTGRRKKGRKRDETERNRDKGEEATYFSMQ